MNRSFSPRTDLAAEWAGKRDRAPEGVYHDERTRGGVTVKAVEIRTAEAAQSLGRTQGRYVTVEPKPFASPVRDLKAEAEALAAEMRELLPKEGPVLVVGLGNEGITPDALGPAAAQGVFVTRHLRQHLSHLPGMGDLRCVSSVAPGVLGQTGIEAAEIVASLTASMHPAAVIAIDALAAAEPERLGRTVQLSDVGIVPGSGVANHRAGLNESTLGVPVMAVGIPTVSEMQVEGGSMLVTPREIDVVIQNAARLISLSVSMALQPGMSAEELMELTGEN